MSIEQKLQACAGMLRTHDLADWEVDFVRNCLITCGPKKQTDQLTDKQLEIVQTIYDRNFV